MAECTLLPEVKVVVELIFDRKGSLRSVLLLLRQCLTTHREALLLLHACGGSGEASGLRAKALHI